jgi:preprotein translocase subunit YajC
MDSMLLPLIILLPLGLLIYQQRKRQRAFVEQQSRVAVGQTVMTTAGLYGEVVALEGEDMVLEVAPGVRLRWNKAAVGRIVTADRADEGLGADEVAEPAADRDAGPDLRKS